MTVKMFPKDICWTGKVFYLASKGCSLINEEYEEIKKCRASFTKQGKLARDHNFKTAPMGRDISAGDLITMHKLKNTDATSHLHIDQRNITSAAKMSAVANKQ